MLPSAKVVKKTALTSMKGKWLNLCISGIVLTSAFMVNSIITGILATVTSYFLAVIFNLVFFILILSPLIYGALFFFKRSVWGKLDAPSLLFICFTDFSQYKRVVKFSLLLFIRGAAVTLVLLLPSMITRVFSLSGFYDKIGLAMPYWAPGLEIVSVVLYIVGAVAAAMFMLRYYLSPFIFVSNKDISPEDAIKLSLTMGKSSISDFIWLVLSMIGWIILSVFIMPLVFTLPYFFCCYVVHARFCITKYNKTVAEMQMLPPSFNPKF